MGRRVFRVIPTFAVVALAATAAFAEPAYDPAPLMAQASATRASRPDVVLKGDDAVIKNLAQWILSR